MSIREDIVAALTPLGYQTTVTRPDSPTFKCAWPAWVRTDYEDATQCVSHETWNVIALLTQGTDAEAALEADKERSAIAGALFTIGEVTKAEPAAVATSDSASYRGIVFELVTYRGET